VDEPVDHRGDHAVAEHLSPANRNWLRFLISYLAFYLRDCVSGVSA